MDAPPPVVPSVCCGIDAHKKTPTACLLTTGASGGAPKQGRAFRTVTGQLQELARRLVGAGRRHVAVEGAGVRWKPVFNALERAGVEVIPVNARRVRNVPGRKTGVRDAGRPAALLRVGPPRAGPVPPKGIREPRGLTRYRTRVIRRRADECNRIQKLLENCNIEPASVASNVPGASGRDMLKALGEGLDGPGALADLARGRLRDKPPRLEEALRGVMSEAQRRPLREQLRKAGEPGEAIPRPDAKAAELCLPFARGPALPGRIPGVNRRAAQVIVAGAGPDMGRFKSAARLAAWAGMCPGNHEGAGERKGGKARKGDRWLRQAPVEAAWASSHTKGTSPAATYHRVKGRRGGKRACLAVGHRILRMAYALLSAPRPFREEGPDDYRPPDRERVKDKLVRRLQRPGYAVTIVEPAA